MSAVLRTEQGKAGTGMDGCGWIGEGRIGCIPRHQWEVGKQA